MSNNSEKSATPSTTGADTEGTNPRARLSEIQPSATLPLSERLEDLGEIGKGGMATVRKVNDRILFRHIAMKVINPKLESDPKERQRFIEEAQLTGQLEHPNIPPIYELGVNDQGVHYFTMRLVRGDTLDLILRSKKFTPTSGSELFRIMQYFVQVCQAISYAHSRGIIHCDLKPANVMVGAHGQVYVMDWGVARLKGNTRPSGIDASDPISLVKNTSNEAEMGKVLGTLAYMSPEQAQGNTLAMDERSDIFSLGAMLYRILVGRPPYHDPDLAVTYQRAKAGQIVPPQDMRRDIPLPKRLCEIAMHAMQREPADRYQTVAALMEDVETFMRGADGLPTRSYPAGHLIIREGDAATTAYVIEKGTCSVFKMVGGQKNVLREMGPGQVFGETALLTSQPRSASVEALEEVHVVEITGETLEKELGQTQWLSPLVKALASRFRDIDERSTRNQHKLILMQTVLNYMSFYGQRVSPVRKETAWSAACVALCEKLQLSKDEVIELIKELPELQIDTEKDIIAINTAILPKH